MSTLPVKAAVQSIDQLWNISYNTEVRYFSWQNTRGFTTDVPPLAGNGHGTQVYAPMSLSLTGNPSPNWKYEFVLRGGFVSSSQTTSGERGSVDTPVDTQLSGTVTYNGLTGFQPFVAMLINAPTGKSALYGNSRFARMDGDLVDQGTYGEGWNFGPTAGVNIPLSQSLILTLSGGYTNRNPFAKESANPITGLITDTVSIRNGDEATVTAALGYAQGPLSLQGSGSYSVDQASQSSMFGMPDFNRYRVGPRTTISGSASYAFNPMWSVYGNGFWTHTDKNDVLDPTGLFLMPEAGNSNSNLFRINTGLNYMFGNVLTVGPIASYLYRDHDGYDPTTFSFVPAKSRWAVGGVANYNVTNKININGRLERVWIRENVNPGPVPLMPIVPFMSGDAWVAAAGATVNF
jgi:predicted porin